MRFLKMHRYQAFETYSEILCTKFARCGKLFLNNYQKETSVKNVNLFVVLAGALSLSLMSAFAEEAKPAAGPSDAEIAHIVVTANAVDIDAGKLGVKKAKSKEVKEFAQLMITDHTAVNKQATDLAKKLQVTPKDNPTSISLATGGKENIAKLKKLRGADFDKEYVHHEVAYHQAVLDAIDQVLVPNAKNEELKNLILKVRPAIDAHLKHAETLDAKLNK